MTRARTKVSFAVGAKVDAMPARALLRNSKYLGIINQVPDKGYLTLEVSSGNPRSVASTIKQTAKRGGIEISAVAVDNVIYLSRNGK